MKMGENILDRQKPGDCRHEPSYPTHDTVVFFLANPNLTGHLKHPDCLNEEIHEIINCGKWNIMTNQVEMKTDDEKIAELCETIKALPDEANVEVYDAKYIDDDFIVRFPAGRLILLADRYEQMQAMLAAAKFICLRFGNGLILETNDLPSLDSRRFYTMRLGDTSTVQYHDSILEAFAALSQEGEFNATK